MAVADEHDLALGQGVGKCAHEGREDHIEQRKHWHQRCACCHSGAPLARSSATAPHEQRVVGQRAEKNWADMIV
jgi:hypothetical protein